jgi:hypothetical protein
MVARALHHFPPLRHVQYPNAIVVALQPCSPTSSPRSADSASGM